MKGRDYPESIVLHDSFEEDEHLIREFSFAHSKRNQALFFFKPECLLPNSCRSPQAVLELVMEKFSLYDVHIAGSLYLAGRRLHELGVMRPHYGYINLLSTSASKCLTSGETERMFETLGLGRGGALPILGGHECLRRYPHLTDEALNDLWLSKQSVKLRSGFYCQSYIVDGEHVVIVNGFHPVQLSHYTSPSHAILLMLVHTDCDWRVLKDDLVGDTFPERAVPESIRGRLFRDQERFGVKGVAVSRNFVHLSAGPFEAMFEIHNFLRGVKSVGFDLRSANMARLMTLAGLGAREVTRCLKNPTLNPGEDKRDLFSLTENVNSDEAVWRYLDWR